MGFVKDEKTFLTLTFMKRILQNRLCEHLDFVVQMFAQPFFHGWQIFKYDDVTLTWTNEKERRGLLAWTKKVLDNGSMLL